MNSIDPPTPEVPHPMPARRAVGRGLVVAIVVAIVSIATLCAWLAYPRYAAYRLERQLQAATTIDQMKSILAALIAERTDTAKDILARNAERTKLAAYDRFHNTMLVIDGDTNELHVTHPWGVWTWSPLTPQQYVDATVIESIPECVTFAVSHGSDDNVTVVLQLYRHSTLRTLTPAELEDWENAGIWRKYTARYRDPVADQRPSWDDQEWKTYREWTSGG